MYFWHTLPYLSPHPQETAHLAALDALTTTTINLELRILQLGLILILLNAMGWAALSTHYRAHNIFVIFSAALKALVMSALESLPLFRATNPPRSYSGEVVSLVHEVRRTNEVLEMARARVEWCVVLSTGVWAAVLGRRVWKGWRVVWGVWRMAAAERAAEAEMRRMRGRGR